MWELIFQTLGVRGSGTRDVGGQEQPFSTLFFRVQLWAWAVFQLHFAVIKNTLTKATLRGEGIVQLPISGCSLSLEEVMAGS